MTYTSMINVGRH